MLMARRCHHQATGGLSGIGSGGGGDEGAAEASVALRRSRSTAEHVTPVVRSRLRNAALSAAAASAPRQTTPYTDDDATCSVADDRGFRPRRSRRRRRGEVQSLLLLLLLIACYHPPRAPPSCAAAAGGSIASARARRDAADAIFQDKVVCFSIYYCAVYMVDKCVYRPINDDDACKISKLMIDSNDENDDRDERKTKNCNVYTNHGKNHCPIIGHSAALQLLYLFQPLYIVLV